MRQDYDHKAIEAKWQARWETQRIYDVGTRDFARPKEYVLVEWPYPSGNLHTGHWYAFAVPDIYVRFRRMCGVQVMYPIGFDAFGLPAENAAIKRGVDPRQWTEHNIRDMQRQLQSMGNAFTSDTTASSIDPTYYRWTQRMFTQFFTHDIAYRGVGVVNWCPSCQTVLANEQVTAASTCERCGAQIEKREMPEWKLRITKYADALVDDLETLDWPAHIKETQRNWIGRSSGAEIRFNLSTGDSVTVFTTRPDTLFGATYLVLAPEHVLAASLAAHATNSEDVSRYIAAATEKAEQDRLDASREKTGVALEGVLATHPATGETIPVYIADYVLAHYGTGAVMGVPAHDERDYSFAQRRGLPLRQVVTPDAGAAEDTKLPYTGEGTLINSGTFTGLDTETAKRAIVSHVQGRMTNTYKLRDWSIGRQRYWGVPIPIVYDPEGTPHAVPEAHLPWLLPADVDVTPTGEPPLAKSEELRARTEAIFGPGWTPEVETMDTFVDSSWYFLRYIDPENSDTFASRAAQEAWMPVDVYFGGAEHTTMHLLYSRFWQKALYDLGLVAHSEPYLCRINRGLVLGPDGNKMSKSKGNVVDPDEHVARVGADTVKMYLAFLGPYGQTANYPWDLGGIAGVRRFLERVYALNPESGDGAREASTTALHRTIAKVRDDIPKYKFNTAISALMEFVNTAEKHGISRDDYRTFVQVLAPFAPHLAEELWERSGEHGSVHQTDFPHPVEEYLRDTQVTIGVQVNGKRRGALQLAPDSSEDEAVAAALALPAVHTHLNGAQPQKVIYVPGKILNLLS